MLIHQTQNLKVNDIVYDILHREYRIIGYSFKYADGKLDHIYFQIQDSNNLTYNNISYKYLYPNLEEFSDPEIEFYEFTNKQTQSNLPIHLMDHDQLNCIVQYFINGYYIGFQTCQNKKVSLHDNQ